MADAQAGSEPLPLRLGRAAAPRPQDASYARAVDNLLMERLAVGEGRALEQLYDRYHILVYSVALRVVRDAMLAEDVVQEVFLRLWRRPESYDPTRGPLPQLADVGHPQPGDRTRCGGSAAACVSRIGRPEAADRVQSTDRLDAPELAAAIGDERRQVRAALASLPPEQRRVLELAYFEGLTQTEIAALTETPLGTVKTRTRLAMNRLRRQLGGERS